MNCACFFDFSTKISGLLPVKVGIVFGKCFSVCVLSHDQILRTLAQ